MHEYRHEDLAVGAVVGARGAMAEAALALEVAWELAAQPWSNSDNDNKNGNGNHVNNNNNITRKPPHGSRNPHRLWGGVLLSQE